MIKHLVMWRVRGATEAEKTSAKRLVKTAFESLNGKIPGMLRLEIGLDTSGADYACDVVLYSEFESQAALDAYAAHPAHLQAKELVGDVRVARYQVDYPVQSIA
jgi:quinol monooxygenase YgiN